MKIEAHYDFDLILSFQTPRCLQHWICKSSPSLVLWQVTKTAQAQIRENISTSQCAVCIVLTLSKSGTLYDVKILCNISKICLLYRNTKTDPVQITAAGKTSQLLPTHKSADNYWCLSHLLICQGCRRFETSVFFSVKINISTTGGFRVGFFQPDTNHP